MKIGRSGVNKLSTMKENISSEAGLSHIYTNHSFRVTAINLWANSGLTNWEILQISGHRNESNVQSYHSIPSVKQLRICSEVLCTALGHDDKVDEQLANVIISMTPLQQLPFSSVNTAISATHQNTAPFSQMFTSCTIGNVHIYTHQPNSVHQFNFPGFFFQYSDCTLTLTHSVAIFTVIR